jgi:hypothetical protein
MTQVLADTSFLYALADRSDKYHTRALAFATAQKIEYLIPDVVLGEVTYALRKWIGKHAEITFLRAQVRSKPTLLALTDSDLARISHIMTRYTRFDFVDCAILTLAERLDITQICTFDRRDFAAYKPTHCEYLELLP